MLLQICNGQQDFGVVDGRVSQKWTSMLISRCQFIHFQNRGKSPARMLSKGMAIPSPTSPSNGRVREMSAQEFPVMASDEILLELSEDRLIELTLAGNEAAYETLVRRHSRRVFSIARHFFRNQETVEDIAQETFAKTFFSL